MQNQTLIPLVPIDVPKLFPEPHVVQGKEICITLPKAIKSRFTYPVKMTISEWASKYRIVTAIDASPGTWRQEMVPHTQQIMDTICKPWVREVWMCAVERSAKTQVLLNSTLWFIDQGGKSGNIFWLMPTELDARTALGERIIPAMTEGGKANRIFRKYLSSRADDTNRGIVRFKHGIRLKPAWSNSPSSLASYFGRFNIADEVDKFAERTSEGTDPITLFLKRSRDDRRGSKYIFASTPAQRFIYKGMLSCQQVYEYRVKCPSCNDFVLMDAEHFNIPDGVTPETIHHAEIEYSCNSCGTLWNENHRRTAYLRGRWFCIKGNELSRPETVGFHFPAFPCPTVPFAEIAGALLKSKTGGIAEKSAWANGYEAIDYDKGNIETITEEMLLRYRSESARNLVAPETARVILVADTQQASFYYEVWCIGWLPEMKMTMIRHGIVERFADLEGLLAMSWRDYEGKEYKISGGLIDSGGTRKAYQKHSRTVEVYDWCSRNRVMMPLKGVHGRSGDLLSYKTITTYPGTNKAVEGGLKRVNVRVDQFKDVLERTLNIEPDDVGALEFHSEIDSAFAKHYTAEKKDEHGDWQHDRKQRNDYWDCTVYALAYREMLSLRKDMRKPVAEIQKPIQKPTGHPQTPNWFNNR